MTSKQTDKQNLRGRHLDRLVGRTIVFAAVLVGGIVGCQQETSPTPFVSVTPTLMPALTVTERPTSYPRNQASPTPPLRPTVSVTDAFAIQLRSRQFVPEAEIRSGLDWLHNVPYGRVHVLLQLYGPPDTTTKTLLEQSGIRLLNYIPSNAWFASIPNTLQADDPALTLVRWFGPILPEDKVPAELLKGTIGGWALREGNKVALVVAFFDDVDLENGQRILLKHGAVIIGLTPISNKITIEISREAILLLAGEDSIRWIDVVPPPPTTDSGGG